MKYRKIALIILSALLVYVLLFKGAQWIESSIKETQSNSKSVIPKEYLSLLSLDTNDIQYPTTIFGDSSVISSFEYLDKIRITAVKLKSSSRYPLNTGVKIYNDLKDLDFDGFVYRRGELGSIELNYNNGYSSINIDSLALHGARSVNIQVLTRNDSVCSFFAENSYGLKVKFNNQDYDDLVMKVLPQSIFEKKQDKNNDAINVALLLKKQRKFIYLYFITKSDSSIGDINPSVLSMFNPSNI